MNFKERVAFYLAYHRDKRNVVTHFIGVPMIIFSILIPMCWLRFELGGILVTGGMIFIALVGIWYLSLNAIVGTLTILLSLPLVYFADQTALMGFSTGGLIAITGFVVGWSFQMLGHYFEGRKPALVDDKSAIFSAPIFLALEILLLLGWGKDFMKEVDTISHKFDRNMKVA